MNNLLQHVHKKISEIINSKMNPLAEATNPKLLQLIQKQEIHCCLQTPFEVTPKIFAWVP